MKTKLSILLVSVIGVFVISNKMKNIDNYDYSKKVGVINKSII